MTKAAPSVREIKALQIGVYTNLHIVCVYVWGWTWRADYESYSVWCHQFHQQQMATSHAFFSLLLDLIETPSLGKSNCFVSDQMLCAKAGFLPFIHSFFHWRNIENYLSIPSSILNHSIFQQCLSKKNLSQLISDGFGIWNDCKI